MGVEVKKTWDIFETIIPGIEREAADVVHTTAALIADIAVHRVLDSPHTGEIYTHGRGPVPHQASAPGESPANWSGELVGNIIAVPTGELDAEVRIGTSYAAELEFGSPNGLVAPRPFVQPSVDEVKPLFEENMRSLVERAARG